jgi:hypothetical protein|tara:strand:+ start:55 stop:504 length:450 start_codon:yes stop_codon:yes gene_type:complete
LDEQEEKIDLVFKYLTQECNIDIFGEDEEVFVNALNNVHSDIIEIYRRINPLEKTNEYTIFLKKCSSIKDLFLVSRAKEIENQIQKTRGLDCNYHNLTMELFEKIAAISEVYRLKLDILKIHQDYKRKNKNDRNNIGKRERLGNHVKLL